MITKKELEKKISNFISTEIEWIPLNNIKIPKEKRVNQLTDEEIKKVKTFNIAFHQYYGKAFLIYLYVSFLDRK